MSSDLALRVTIPRLLSLKGAVWPIVVAITYFLGAKAAFFIGTLSDKIFAPFWPPNTILFCALLLTAPRRWWLFIVAAFPAHALVEMEIGMGAQQMLVAFITNCAVAGTNAFAVQRLLGMSDWFGTLRKAALYILITALFSPAVSALGGAFVQILGGGSLANYGLYWAHWYASNALGSLALAPIAMIVLSEIRRSEPFVFSYRHLEAALVTLALVAICTIAFELSGAVGLSGYLPALLYLPLPLILWSVVRFGVGGAASAVFVVSLALIWRTLNGPSLFVVGDSETNVFALQIFLISLSAPTLLLGGAIEEARRAEQGTRESEERIAFVAASANLGLWRHDFSTNQFWATAPCFAMFGLSSRGTPSLENMFKHVHPGDFPFASASMKSALHRRMPMDIEFRVPNGTEKIRWLAVRARPEFDDKGTVIALTGAFTDITSRKAAEAEAALQRQEIAHLMRVSMLGELSGSLAHELTQPLTAILSNAQAGKMLLVHDAPNLEELSEVLDDIIAEDSRAGEVIHRLRDLLKKGKPNYEAADLNALINTTTRLLHSELINRRITVNIELALGLPLTLGDTVQLQQVLINLLMNAMDAVEEMSPSRRHILISTVATADGEAVEVRISDSGPGLQASDRQRVFQPFYTTKKRGLGLGLSICSSIIKSHGGVLSLENNEMEGATASFRLPAQKI